MSTQRPNQTAPDQQPQGATETHLPILGLIENLERSCTPDAPPDEFTRQVLEGFVGLAEAVHGSYWRIEGEQHSVAIVHQLAPRVSEQAAANWEPILRDLAAGVVQQGIIRYRSVAEPSDALLTGRTYAAIGFPIRGEGTVAGCITLVADTTSGVFSGAGIALLRLMADFGLLYTAVRAAARSEGSYRALSGAWDMVGELLAFTKPDDMAQVLADRARSAFGARRVSVGFVDGEKAKVAAVSGEDTVDKRSNIVRLIQTAQQEVVISGEPGLYVADAPAEERAQQVTRNPQQERLARSAESAAVYSVPLWKEGELVGVWTFEFEADKFRQGMRRVIDVSGGQAGPLLHLARLNERGLVRRARDAAEAGAKAVFGKEHPWRKVAAVAIVAVAAFAVLGRVDFKIGGSSILAPSVRHIYSAPFATTIAAAPVRPGDRVDAGQPLVEFDRRELEMRLREALSKREAAEKEASTYLAQDDKIAQYAEARARRDSLEAEAELLRSQLDRTTVRAESAGIVITGDLTQDIGRPVQMGEALVEVAPLGEFVLEMELAQGDVRYVQPGQEGRFTTKADPTTSYPFMVDKVRPAPEVRGNHSVYVVEARVPNPDERLRPGMEGAAKIRVDRRNVTWTVTRKMLDWLRLHLWW